MGALMPIFQLYLLGVNRRKSHRPAASHWQTLSHNVVLSTPCNVWKSNSYFLVLTEYLPTIFDFSIKEICNETNS